MTARRLRQVHPIAGPTGEDAWLYDLERTHVIPVPDAIRPALPTALAGEPTPAARAWLEAEDVLTEDAVIARSDAGRIKLPVVTDVSIDLAGACNMGCTYCFEDDIDSRLGPMSAETMRAAVDMAFRQARDAPRVTVHFGSGETLIRFPMLVELVATARARAAAASKTVGFELTTNATLVTAESAAFLRDHGFNVRVSCDGPAAVHDRFRPMMGGKPSYAAVERGLRILLDHLPDRVTVNSVLAYPTRLRDLWAWAKQLGLRRHHVIKVGAHPGRELNLDDRELTHFVADLDAICDEIIATLEAGERPIDYQPITKIIRRLMVPEPITRFCGVAGSYLGIASDGKVYPCFRHLGLPQYHLGDIRAGVDDERRHAFLASEA
ncbi:MAG TPA: radical SAM protein, partial [Kofleriaceae bacterium]|nr:radical SAM protein [Kofleriaceae bacterium]